TSRTPCACCATEPGSSARLAAVDSITCPPTPSPTNSREPASPELSIVSVSPDRPTSSAAADPFELLDKDPACPVYNLPYCCLSPDIRRWGRPTSAPRERDALHPHDHAPVRRTL